jgi:hypothetical protein
MKPNPDFHKSKFNFCNIDAQPSRANKAGISCPTGNQFQDMGWIKTHDTICVFPNIGVPPNHPFSIGIFMKNDPAIGVAQCTYLWKLQLYGFVWKWCVPPIIAILLAIINGDNEDSPMDLVGLALSDKPSPIQMNHPLMIHYCWSKEHDEPWLTMN